MWWARRCQASYPVPVTDLVLKFMTSSLITVFILLQDLLQTPEWIRKSVWVLYTSDIAVLCLLKQSQKSTIFKMDHTGKPVLVATSIKQATWIKQACIQFPQQANILKCTCFKQAPVFSRFWLPVRCLLNTGWTVIGSRVLLPKQKSVSYNEINMVIVIWMI